MTKERRGSRHIAQIASLTPGRLRLKLHRGSRDPSVMHRIKDSLESREGVNKVKVNPLNGGLTVHYDRDRHAAAGILGWLEDLDVMVESIGHLPSLEASSAPNGESFLTAIEDLNRRVRTVTGLPLDVKLILPLAFFSAGIWSTIRKGLMIESVPGWLFLWFAFDLFVKLHPNHRDRPAAAPFEANLRRRKRPGQAPGRPRSRKTSEPDRFL